MNTRIVIPAITSLALFVGNPAFALVPAGGAIHSGQIEKTISGVVPASLSKTKVDCRQYYNYHARSRCRQVHGKPDPVN
ncbi:hypothetical protein SAMN05444161_7001 [Rhizobiales bacterium GAS191]|nr:hypothetical protein SAMN05519103_06308 [Rhizobiales bacterium GAS113]SEE75202.1 hypothetical protein SAMN05444161_7001 [Rhizobiales bacterium GAS191]